MSEEPSLSLNLGNIQTQWSMVRQAHQSSGDRDESSARQQLVMRYASAIRRFVQIVVQDNHLADELSQDAIMRLLKGDFSGADQNRGRFRDLLKTAIRNMARNHWSKEKVRASVDFEVDQIGKEGGDSELDEEWTKQCRDAALTVAWDKLRSFEDSTPDNYGYTALKLRSQYPDADSPQMANLVSEKVGRPIKADTLRQQIRRARLRFAEYLVADIADGLADPTPDNIREELVSLGLFSSVKDLLPE